MSKKRGVSSKTHTQKQLDDYANQHNPNSKAYQARMSNQENAKKKTHHRDDLGVTEPLDWMCYGNPFDFD